MKRRAFVEKSAKALAGISAGCLIPPEWRQFSSGFERSLSPPPKTEEIRVLELRGTPQQRGQSHGEALRDEISELIKIWRDDLRKNRRKDPDTCLDDFLENTRFPQAIQRWTPDLLDEVRGIAEFSDPPVFHFAPGPPLFNEIQEVHIRTAIRHSFPK